jgi:uncharacterized membrane protein
MATEEQNKSITQVVYGLYAASLIVGVTSIVAIILNYVKKDDVVGTMYESHFRWQIRTFWFSVLWNIVGWLAVVTLIGIPIAVAIWIATTIWVLYRLIRGYLLFKDSKPVPGM